MSNGHDYVEVGQLFEAALKLQIDTNLFPKTWKVRTIIAAHRARNTLALDGPGYGAADWKGLKPERDASGVFTRRLVPGSGSSIKQSVKIYLDTGKLPYVVERMAHGGPRG